MAEYHFGSEAMVGHGGWAYESQAHYLASGLIEGGAFLIVALLCVIGSIRIWRAPNKPLQPTRAASLHGQRETARCGPRGSAPALGRLRIAA